MAELLEELVEIEITKPLPEMGVAGVTYKIEGTIKMFDAIGAPPWVYAEVRRKEWWKPEFIEEVSYERGFPIPVTGTFSIDIKPEKKSDYEVTLIATPAPLALPIVGVFPVVGKSDMVKLRVAEEVATDIKNIAISVVGPVFPSTDIKNIAISVVGPVFPSTDIKNIAISVIGPAYPATDLRNIEISVIGPEFPATDIKNIEIALVAVPVEYKGTISKKELEYNQSRASIPAYNIAQDKEGKVHIWGRNDMATNQKLGIHWIVRDPDGLKVEDYEDWEGWPNTDPGKTHEFISPGRFDLNKPGTWTIAISLSMNPDSPLTVASYTGVLCTVKEEVVPEFKGTISKKELEYDESRGAIPAYNVPQGKRGLVHVWGRNDMAISQKLGIRWIVKDPDGIVVEDYQDWQFGSASPGATHEFIGGRFDIDKPGNWTIGISLAMNPESPVQVASYAGVLCTVAAAPPTEYTLEVLVEPPGAGLVLISPKGPYPAGTVVTLVATPYSGYEFDHWGGWPPYPGVGSTSSTLNIAMTANWQVVAAFRVKQYTLTWSITPSGSGTIAPASGTKYPSGTSATLIATASSGYEFDHWGGAASGTSPTTTVIMSKNQWVVAYFKEVAIKQCPLSASASPSSGGSVTRSPYKSLYDDGETVTVTATARSGWSFDKFTGRRFDGSTWTSSANPVHPRGCRTRSVTAHFIQ